MKKFHVDQNSNSYYARRKSKALDQSNTNNRNNIVLDPISVSLIFMMKISVEIKYFSDSEIAKNALIVNVKKYEISKFSQHVIEMKWYVCKTFIHSQNEQYSGMLWWISKVVLQAKK